MDDMMTINNAINHGFDHGFDHVCDGQELDKPINPWIRIMIYDPDGGMTITHTYTHRIPVMDLDHALVEVVVRFSSEVNFKEIE